MTILVFPETMNHSCLASTAGQLAQIKALLELQDVVLTSEPDDLAPGAPLSQKIMGMRAAIIGGQKACELCC